MNSIRRILRSMREHSGSNAGFEAYYGALVQHQPEGVPTAAEARRDFREVRKSLDRIALM